MLNAFQHVFTYHVPAQIRLNINNLPIDFVKTVINVSDIPIVLLAFYPMQPFHSVRLANVADILD